MRVLVCGGRDFSDIKLFSEILNAVDKKYPIATIIHGAAKGADTLAHLWGLDNHKFVWPFPADWEKHGKSAGPIRNIEMLKETTPDLVIAFPGGKGTQHMMDIAKEHGYMVIKVLPNGQTTVIGAGINSLDNPIHI